MCVRAHAVIPIVHDVRLRSVHSTDYCVHGPHINRRMQTESSDLLVQICDSVPEAGI